MHRADVKGRTGRSTPRMRGSTAKDARLRETEQQLAEALQQQIATADVLKVISRSHFDLKAVLDTLVRSVSRLCNVDATSIVRYTGEKLSEVAIYGYTPEYIAYIRNYPYELGRGTVVGRTFLEGRAVQIEDVLADPEYTLIEGQRLGGFRTVLGVPLLREGQVIGVLVLSRNTVQPFTERQIALVTTFADQAVIAIENTRLLEELRDRSRDLQEALDYQTATGDVLNVISRSPSEVMPVFDVIVKTAATLCTAEYAFIARPRDGHCHMVAANNVALAHIQFLLRNPAPISRDSILGRVTIERRTIHVPDVLDDPEFKRHDWQKIGKQRTVLGVPLVRDGNLLGVLILARTQAQPFTDKQVNLVTTFADQAVIAIENARLFEEVQARTSELARSVEDLRALSEVSHAVNSTLDLETVLRTIVAKAVELSVTEAGAIYVFSHVRQQFRLRATYGMSEEMIAAVGRHHIGPGESYIGQATQRGEALQIPDLEAEQPSAMRDLVLQAGYRALLVVPLLRPGRVVGALVVRRRAPGPFRASIVHLLETFATQSVLAIQNARLFEEVEARTRELARSLAELQAAQDRLIQTEKLASLGQLTAGIAHEIKNPLNFVNNFAALSVELLDELKGALSAAPEAGAKENIEEVMALLAGNLEKIVQHGTRADSIVKNMLLHSRTGSGRSAADDLNALVEESLNLAYHGARAARQDFNVTIEKSLDASAGVADLYPQEITSRSPQPHLERLPRGDDAQGRRARRLRAEAAGGDQEPRRQRRNQDQGQRHRHRRTTSGRSCSRPSSRRSRLARAPGWGCRSATTSSSSSTAGRSTSSRKSGEFTAFKIVLPRSGHRRRRIGASHEHPHFGRRRRARRRAAVPSALPAGSQGRAVRHGIRRVRAGGAPADDGSGWAPG